MNSDIVTPTTRRSPGSGPGTGLGRTIRAGVAAAVLGGLLVPVAAAPAAALPTPTGHAWPAISDEVDELVNELIEDQNLPGVGVSVSKDGRLVVSRGYGYADVEEGTSFGDDMRSKFGSNTKPLITGPAAWTAVTEAGLDPATLRVYGPGSVFGSAFDDDIEAGSEATGTPLDWYYDITVQHLLDHRSGYARSGDGEAAAEMLGIAEEDLTYAQVHSHFLRTRGLLTPVGTYEYSNHGYGVLSMVVETLTGDSFGDYVDSTILAPRGLSPEIQWNFTPVTDSTAVPHRRDSDGDPEPYTDVIVNTLGAGAGGYRGSTRDAVELMVSLAEDHTDAELDAMGWASGGTVSHNGRVGGGTSHVRVTGDGIAIALQTNISDSDAPLSGVAADIIDLVRDAEIPSHYDIWKGCTLPAATSGSAQVARHGIPAGSYQCTVDQLVGAGYRVDRVDAFDAAGAVRFNALFSPDQGSRWRAFHGLTGGDYQELFDDLTSRGYRPRQVDSYRSGGGVRYAGVFVREDGPDFAAYHGLTAAQHQDRFDDLTAEGLRPVSISVVTVGGTRRYTGVYQAGGTGSFWMKSGLTPAQYQDAFDDQLDAGRVPVHLDGYTAADGNPRIAAIFSSKPWSVRARHGLTSAGYQAAWQDATDDGFRTVVVTGYDGGSGPRYAAVWRKG
jgi:CubicO group peptidase (beta-lactamase class C family)